tara:strand:- start:296 stop:1147 length:852 start_codon:yes stop_codon:yes gene_type:complete
MAVETVKQITAPPEFLEAEAKLYLDQLRPAIAGFKGADLSQVYGPQFQAGLGQLTQDAISKAGGLGSFEPFLQTAATEAGQAGQFVGPTAYQQFMSPYQQDVIDTTLAEFDRQTQAGIPGLRSQAITAGAFGGAREGVQEAEYLSGQARNRAALQAQLLQQGFGQAQQAAGQAFAQQQALSQQQSQLAALAPQLAGSQIAGLTTLGGIQQAQEQAGLSAQQQLAQQQLQQPLTAAQQYGSGVTSLISGYPGQQSVGQVPVPGIAQTAIGAGTTLAGIYGAMNK